MKLAFIILAHDDLNNLFRLIKRLLVDNGDLVVVHWDKKNPLDIEKVAWGELDAGLLARVRFAGRFSVRWGHWSMVEATLAALEEIEKSAEAFDYTVLLSGSDYPIKPISALKAFMSHNNSQEYIECVDPEQNAWVAHGMAKERYQYHHWFTWRDNPRLLGYSINAQKKLGVKRRLPKPLKAHFGSQWWALTWPTLRQVLELSRQPAIRRFFKTTAVPDELFFQTLVASLVPSERIAATGLTFYHFTQQGKPLVFYNDHFTFLRRQDYFLARKLSPHASALRDQLDAFIDPDGTAATPPLKLAKQLYDYEFFRAVQWRGLPGRRVVGRQHDDWYGDLEWNKRPYFVIVCYQDARLEPLRQALNNLPGVCCYGDIFHRDFIDYALPDRGHPFYPHDKPALRDMKRPNFLCDLLHAHPKQLIGFVLRLPCGHEMEKVVVFDPQATLIFVSPDDCYLPAGGDALNWPCAFTNMIMHDNLHEARRTGKRGLLLITRQHGVSVAGIEQATTYIKQLQTDEAC
jgi:hypothetical protein